MKNRDRFAIAWAAAAASLLFVVALLPGRALGGPGVDKQLGLRYVAGIPPFAIPPFANAKIGDTFECVVLDPTKLSGFGFRGIKRNDKVSLKIVGPNNAFDVLHASSRQTKSFDLDAQGALKLRIGMPSPQ